MIRAFMTGLVVALVVCAGATRSTGAVGSLPAGGILVTRADMSRSPPRPDLYVMNPDGSHLRLLLRNGADAAVGRDGTQIAFVRDGAIWTSRRDGSGARRLTWPSAGVADDDPTWSRDGRVLYFSRSSFEYDQTASLFTIGADGRGISQLTRAPQSGGEADEPACHFWPSVSPAGSAIVYTVVGSCAHGIDRSIAAVAVGGRPLRLGFRFPWPATFVEPEYFSAAWAPNRAEIAYAAVDDRQYAGWVYLSPTNGTSPQSIFSWKTPALDGYPEGLDSPPAWSSDGRWLAVIPPIKGFVNYRKYVTVGRGDIWLISADGSSQQQLTTAGMFTAATWLPPVRRARGG